MLQFLEDPDITSMVPDKEEQSWMLLLFNADKS